MKKRLIPLISSGLLGITLYGCGGGGGSSGGATTPTNNTSTPNMVRASYIDTSATGAVATVTTAGYNASNIIIFGFASTNSSTVASSMLTTVTTAVAAESAGTLNFISIGGEAATVASVSDTATLITNVDAQIKSINTSVGSTAITGVDLDLENGVAESTITALAKGFHDLGYKVSVAPQVYLSSGTDVSATSPTNLVLTSGYPLSNSSTYNPAIANGYVDYIFAQTYNTSGWTVTTSSGSYSENQEGFYKAVSQALNNTVQNSCSSYTSSTTTTCIPSSTKLIVGTVANAGAASNSANIFGVAAGTSYSQSTILTQLRTDIDAMLSDTTNYKYFAGTMVWSLTNDYDPTDYNDSSATAGAFSQTIFGAAASPSVWLQVSNISTDGYVAVSLCDSSWNCYVFGNSSSQPLSGGTSTLWGTSAAVASGTYADTVSSSYLNSMFSTSTSFTASTVMINIYSSSTSSLWSPTKQVECKTNPTISSGSYWNIMMNSSGGCTISQVK